jgi:hypothetical protein
MRRWWLATFSALACVGALVFVAKNSAPTHSEVADYAATTLTNLAFVTSDAIVYRETLSTQQLLDTAHSCTCPKGRNVCICTSYRAAPILKPLAAKVVATNAPTPLPTMTPTLLPSLLPSTFPTLHPSVGTPSPTQIPTAIPTPAPTLNPTAPRTAVPSFIPTVLMTLPPTSVAPTLLPTASPSAFPTLHPTSPPAPPRVVDVLNKTSVTTTVHEVPVEINGTDEYQTVKARTGCLGGFLFLDLCIFRRVVPIHPHGKMV